MLTLSSFCRWFVVTPCAGVCVVPRVHSSSSRWRPCGLLSCGDLYAETHHAGNTGLGGREREKKRERKEFILVIYKFVCSLYNTRGNLCKVCMYVYILIMNYV